MLLKHLSNFWRTLDIPLINDEISLVLTWSENCVLTDIITHIAVAAQGYTPTRPDVSAPTNATFQIKDTKLYVPVVTLSTQDDNKRLEQFKTGFKRTIKWNKYRSEMANQAKTNNLHYLIDPIFIKVNRLFVFSLKNENDRFSFPKYYTPNVEIKDFNILIEGKSFFQCTSKKSKKKRKDY